MSHIVSAALRGAFLEAYTCYIIV